MSAKFGQMYGACVWALTITSTCGSSPCAIAVISGRAKPTQRSTSTYAFGFGGDVNGPGAGGFWKPP